MKAIADKQAEMFLTQQISMNNEKEMAQFIRSYESKVLDLRKMIQTKEGMINEYANQIKLSEE